VQILNRKKGNEFIQVEIVRGWQDVGGGQIGLTPSGDYITLDGKLVEDPRLFSIMPSAEQKKAEAWWRRKQDKVEAEAKDVGQTKTEEQDIQTQAPDSSSAETVSAVLDTMQKNQAEFLAKLAGLFAGASLLEAPKFKAVYTRQKGESINCTAPKGWKEFGFTEEPDWWGVEAERTEMGEGGVVYTYRRYLVPDDQGGDELGD